MIQGEVFLKLMCAGVMSLATALALCQTSAAADESPAADPAKGEAETADAAGAKEEEEFDPPPGYKARKRGKFTVYCIKDSSIGTKFLTEKCYDEAQIRAMILEREQNNRDFDRVRAICSGCAAP